MFKFSFLLVITSSAFYFGSAEICNPQCINGGICWLGTCLCRMPFRGKFCNQAPIAARSESAPRIACSLNCLNSGTCDERNRCFCPASWSGSLCQYRTIELRKCNKESLVAQCQPGQVLRFDKALYGRFDGDKTHCKGRWGRKLGKACGSGYGSLQSLRRCNGQQRCVIDVRHKSQGGIFANHCPGKPKYLWVRFHCEPTEIIPGQWGPWSAFSECSSTCDGGTRSRVRICDNALSGEPCVGKTKETELCNEAVSCLPSTYYWSLWSPWSACSVSCGTGALQGTRSRNRNCLEVRTGSIALPSNCAPSTSSTSQIEPCSNIAECPELTRPVLREWSQWSRCTVSCGIGFRSRRRGCFDAVSGLRLSDRQCSNQSMSFTQNGNCFETTCPGTNAVTSTTLSPLQPVPKNLWGHIFWSNGYCNSTGLPLNNIGEEDCGDACFQWIECRGVTYDRRLRRCFPLRSWCANRGLTPYYSDNLVTYKKNEPRDFECGLEECGQIECTAFGTGPNQFNCASPSNSFIVGYSTHLASASDCARACDSSTGKNCLGFQWGPSHTFYRLKYDYLDCALLNRRLCPDGNFVSTKTLFCRRGVGGIQ